MRTCLPSDDDCLPPTSVVGQKTRQRRRRHQEDLQRLKIINYCKQQDIDHVDIWTGAEFQEKLQSNAPDLLKRFCEGDPFPEIKG